MIPYNNIQCDETTHNSNVLYTHYNNGRYIERVTCVNEAR